MTQDAARKIKATHLSRQAFVYIRQSTLQQVADNQESTRRQYGLRERARALGWVPEQLITIDCDLGVSGASANREGFKRLVAEVGMGHVGIVLGLEVSRLARNCTDWHRLLEICGLTETLILDEDGLYDPTDYNDRLLLGLKGTLSEAELHLLRARMRGGLLAKAHRGELRVGLPVGLVYDERGQVVLHPDAQVRSTIHLFFRTFFRTGAACATVKYFNENKISFPAPARVGAHSDAVVWGRLTLSRALNLLHNPRYAGAYVFGRRRSRKQPDGRQHTIRLPREEWEVLLLDMHEGYISWQDYERIQEQLRASALAYGLEQRHAPPREGPALLQGLALCGRCGGRMSVRYHQRGDKLVPDYICQVHTMQYRDPPCQSIPGADIDAAVGKLLIETMSPMAVELTLGVQAELEARAEETDRLRRQQVVRAEHEAELARRRYMQVDPSNRLVASSLEADWNDKLRAAAELRERVEREDSSSRAAFDETAKQRVRALAANLPVIWNDPSTPQRERKRIAALLLADVTLRRDEEKVSVGIRFRGGATSSIELSISLNAWRTRMTHPKVVAKTKQLLEEEHDVEEVAERLNAEGLRTGAQQRFDGNAVRWICYTHGLKSPSARLRDSGKLTTRKMAAVLGIEENRVRRWARDGRLRATRKGRRPQWLFEPINEQPEAAQRVAQRRASGQASQTSPKPTPSFIARARELLLDGHEDAVVAEHLNAEGYHRASRRPFNAAAVRVARRHWGLNTSWEAQHEAGKLSASEMAVRLGIGLSTLHKWARGECLRGQRCTGGRFGRWMFDPIEEQPEEIQKRAARVIDHQADHQRDGGLLSIAAIGRGAV